MKRKLALIPLDARPITRELPGQIAAIAGWEVLVPDCELLGFLKTPGKRDDILEWISSVADEVDGFIVSLDMIGYGGLVPSRVIEDDFSSVWNRIEKVLAIKRRYPEKKIYAFSSTMRISNSYVNEEEKDYWDRYGREIWEYSYQYHRYKKTSSEEAKIRVEQLKDLIPDHILLDYLQTRERNFKINKKLLDKVEEMDIDLLIFPQDDTSEYGLNIMEQEFLSAEIEKKRLFHKVLIYPGADEVATMLTARSIMEIEQVSPPVFYAFFSGEAGKLKPALYEDRPIYESVKGQIYASGSFLSDTAGEADLILAVNVPGERQGDLALQADLEYADTSGRNLGEWIRKIRFFQRKDYPVAIADLAYANGADPAMISRVLAEKDLLNYLIGFAAWNTAGNTIGTVVAQASMVYLRKKQGLDLMCKPLKEQILLRILEDYLYQTVVRDEVRQCLDEAKVDTSALEAYAIECFLDKFSHFIKEPSIQKLIHNNRVIPQEIFLPWKRTFEMGIRILLIENSEVNGKD
ncbi:uncharacterized protein DUF4127 [Melghiribacillus thermohalophilus]|uniref:Uncharacterized protein DUF4127 n=1 Tax=Melghiribacillus thermohalophilus TaxID=1324956 RepID=A0A4R3N1G7_9BACI|nr:DUF4127 family protein [Melghiribacillus thermohalophilus]TCT21756.1 uncharacterized protein DUF4127 [Melghiribacillus thermohalophilus]